MTRSRVNGVTTTVDSPQPGAQPDFKLDAVSRVERPNWSAMSSVTSGASVVKKVGRTVPRRVDQHGPVQAEDHWTQRHQRFSRVFRLGRHPFERLEIGLQTAPSG